MVLFLILCLTEKYGLISELCFNTFWALFDVKEQFKLLRNPSTFKIKACLEILNVLSFLGIVRWVLFEGFLL